MYMMDKWIEVQVLLFFKINILAFESFLSVIWIIQCKNVIKFNIIKIKYAHNNMKFNVLVHAVNYQNLHKFIE